MPAVDEPIIISTREPHRRRNRCDHLKIRKKGREHLQLLAWTLVFAAGSLLGEKVWRDQSQCVLEMVEMVEYAYSGECWGGHHPGRW